MANYHVNYLTGSDVTGDGGTVNPWATIQHALTTSSASTGDVIKVVGSTTTDLTTTATFALRLGCKLSTVSSIYKSK